MKFKVGDIVKGMPGNDYAVTDENMYKGEVVEVFDSGMVIKVLDHKSKEFVGEKYTVENNEKNFELIPRKKPTKEELLKMPIGAKITTNKDYDNIFVKIFDEMFENCHGDTIADCDIEKDLSINDPDYGTKILKIEVPTYETVYDSSKEVKEMTMDEVCKALGYNIKIIKEK